MDTNERTQQLRDLMAEHGLSEQQVGEMLGRTAMTVKIWRCQSEESKCIPAHMLELLRLKLSPKALAATSDIATDRFETNPFSIELKP